MSNLLIEKLKISLFASASNVNSYAEQQDNNRNHTNYGSASAIAAILRDLNCEVTLPVWEDKGYLKIPFIQVDDWKVKFHNGK